MNFSFKKPSKIHIKTLDPQYKNIRQIIVSILIEAMKEGKQIIYIDEFGVDKSTRIGKAWMEKSKKTIMLDEYNGNHFTVYTALSDTKVEAYQIE